jgi:hypothetical protein
MVQRGQRVGFTGEPLAELVGIELRIEQLDGDQAIRVGVMSQVESAYPASPDEALYFVTPNLRRQHQHRGRLSEILASSQKRQPAGAPLDAANTHCLLLVGQLMPEL